MTASVTQPPNDPDLVLALDELSRVVGRLPQIEEQIRLDVVRQSRRQFEHLVSVHTGLLDTISSRAGQMKMKGGTLRLMIEIGNEFRARTGRRIPLEQLVRQTRVVLSALHSASRQADAAHSIATYRRENAASAVINADEAVRYLEASRG